MKKLLKKSQNIVILVSITLMGILTGFLLSHKYSITRCSPVLLNTLNLPKTSFYPCYKTSFYYEGLVSVSQYDPNIVIDLRYATNNNFTKNKIYPKSVCLLQRNTLKKLIAANKEFESLGYRIKIWDAFRPKHIQMYLWDLVKDRRFIASPYVNWSRHNRGAAVDITLVDKNGIELKMPTGFDTFSTDAYRIATNINPAAKKNMELLTSIMLKHGFKPIETEWWHFDDSEADSYPLIDLDFNKIYN